MKINTREIRVQISRNMRLTFCKDETRHVYYYIFVSLLLLLHRNSITETQRTRINTFVNFATRVYLRAWYIAPAATSSPEKIVREALTAVSQHLWYLGRELVGLSFYDDCVALGGQQKMVNALGRELAPTSRLRTEKLPDQLVLSTSSPLEQ